MSSSSTHTPKPKVIIVENLTSKYLVHHFMIHGGVVQLPISLLRLKPFRFAYPRSWYLMEHLRHFMLMVNSSINFLIYCSVGTEFRMEMKKMLYELRIYFLQK